MDFQTCGDSCDFWAIIISLREECSEMFKETHIEIGKIYKFLDLCSLLFSSLVPEECCLIRIVTAFSTKKPYYLSLLWC